VATFASLETIIRFVYDLPSYRVVGGAEWVRRDRFDIEARAGRDASAAEITRMVLAMLKDRFQLVIRQEKREGPIYALVVARGDKQPGPNLRASTGDCAKPVSEEQRTPNGGASIQRTCAPMSVLMSILSKHRSRIRPASSARGISNCRTPASDEGTFRRRLPREIRTMRPPCSPPCRNSSACDWNLDAVRSMSR
jgi:uncharacterized protein (TIGR03435 family)